MRPDLRASLARVWAEIGDTGVTGVTGVTTGIAHVPGHVTAVTDVVVAGEVTVTEVPVTPRMFSSYASNAGNAPEPTLPFSGEGRGQKRSGCDELLCPADLAERSARLEFEEGLSRTQAERLALDIAGLPSYQALADAWRVNVHGELTCLAPPCSSDGQRLLNVSLRFLDTRWLPTAVALGWSMVDLFGIGPSAPLERECEWGLVTRLALAGAPGAKLERMAEDQAIIRKRSGALETWWRFRPEMNGAVPWWTCTELLGEPHGC